MQGSPLMANGQAPLTYVIRMSVLERIGSIIMIMVYVALKNITINTLKYY